MARGNNCDRPPVITPKERKEQRGESIGRFSQRTRLMVQQGEHLPGRLKKDGGSRSNFSPCTLSNSQRRAFVVVFTDMNANRPAGACWHRHRATVLGVVAIVGTAILFGGLVWRNSVEVAGHEAGQDFQRRFSVREVTEVWGKSRQRKWTPTNGPAPPPPGPAPAPPSHPVPRVFIFHAR